jgi:hypothetical protein
VHDYYCETRKRKYGDVHAMFYEAMLCAQVGAKRAFIMYEAVKQFGPRWPDPAPRPPQCDTVTPNYDFDLCTKNAPTPPLTLPPIDRTKLEEFLERVKTQGADPEDVEKLQAAAKKI